MKRIHEVILDLDDVLNTFCMSALHHVGVSNSNYDYSEYPQHAGWDIVHAANYLRRTRGVQFPAPTPFTAETFWESLPRGFWAEISPVPYMYHLLDYLAERVGRDNIILATSPTLSPECLAGKLEWIQNYLPLWMQRQYMIGPCKDRLANPHALLIDDRKGNCEKFEARGGQALLVHKPWNYVVRNKINEPIPVDWEYQTRSSLECGLYRTFRKRIDFEL